MKQSIRLEVQRGSNSANPPLDTNNRSSKEWIFRIKE
jgi:hypothetical protein